MDADDTELQLDEMAEALDGTIRTLVRTHPGIELDDLAERATEALLGEGEQRPTSPLGPAPADSREADTYADAEHDADHDAVEDPDASTDLLAHVEVEDLVTDLVYAHTFELCDQHGPLIETADGKLLDLSEMVTDKVFTHRVDAVEAQRRGLDIGFDLWALSGSTVTGGEGPERITVTQDYFLAHWDSPAWEDLLADGSLVAVSVDGAGVASIRVLDEEPPLDPEILESFRSAYELHCEATDAPPSSDLLVAEMLLDEPSTFDVPTAPLSDYATSLGLEVRRSVVADDPAQWRILGTEHRLERLTDWFDPSTNLAAMEVVDVAERIALGEPLEDHTPGEDHRPAEDTAEVHRVVESLSRRPVREAVSDEFFGDHEGFLAPVDPQPFLDLALGVADQGEPLAAVHLMRQRMWQHRGDLDAAEGELRKALVEDPQFTDAADRLAWFASLRGDAVTALQLWQGIPPHPETARNIAIIEPFAHPRTKPGRNEPCWCGSGIKFKKCHRDMAPVAPLAERVPWLWRQAFGFVATTGITGRKHVVEVAVARAGDTDDPKAIDAAFADPLTMDLVLTEGGALSDFLDAVGELLPADERQLVATWLDVPRSVHELIETDPGAPVVVRDLHTGNLLTLTGTAFPQAARPGQLICAHVVPDALGHEGDAGHDVGHQIVGGVFEVPDGAQQALLEVLDSARAQRRGAPIAAWLAKLERSPDGP